MLLHTCNCKAVLLFECELKIHESSHETVTLDLASPAVSSAAHLGHLANRHLPVKQRYLEHFVLCI